MRARENAFVNHWPSSRASCRVLQTAASPKEVDRREGKEHHTAAAVPPLHSRQYCFPGLHILTPIHNDRDRTRPACLGQAHGNKKSPARGCQRSHFVRQPHSILLSRIWHASPPSHKTTESTNTATQFQAAHRSAYSSSSWNSSASRFPHLHQEAQPHRIYRSTCCSCSLCWEALRFRMEGRWASGRGSGRDGANVEETEFLAYYRRRKRDAEERPQDGRELHVWWAGGLCQRFKQAE
jgi:hypothetical protein